MKAFATRIKERSKALGLSQVEVARRCKLTEKALNHYTAGRSEPSLSMLLRIAIVLDCTPNDLLGVSPLPSLATGSRAKLRAQISATCQPMTERSLELSLSLLKTVLEQQLETDGSEK